jgi:DNA adenine methylase
LNIIANTKSRGVDDGLKLYQILINACNTFGSKGSGNILKESSGNRKMKNINEYKERLKNTKIFSSDYKNIIKKFDATDTFFFLDPPYEKSEGLYKNAVIDYEEMNDLLSKIKGKFLLTMNSSSEIKNIFRNFNIKEIKVKGLGTNEKGIGQDRMELLITNF